jgi:tRNA threonylcarbamoyladenosine biosynthesis protein TsaE
MTVIVICDDLDATSGVARRLAHVLQAGDVVLLSGELGAGKTAFTQALAEGLGVEEAVTSPTFTLMRPYRTAKGFDLLHVDVYRLNRLDEVADLGLPELLEDGACAVVEWGERAASVLGPDHLHVTMERGDTETARIIRLEPHGRSWETRLDQDLAMR